MKGIFIPEITVEMFRDGCLESIETLMTEGEVYDIEYDPKTAEPEPQWIPCSERQTGSCVCEKRPLCTGEIIILAAHFTRIITIIPQSWTS